MDMISSYGDKNYLSMTLAMAAHLPSERRAPKSQPPSISFFQIRSSSPSMQAVMYRTSIVPIGSCATSSAVKQSKNART